jgi:hypothetical protein
MTAAAHRPDIRSPGHRPKFRHSLPDDDLSRIAAALQEVARLLPCLSDLLPESGGQGPQTGVIGRHAPASSEPWQAEAATAYWTLHAGIRSMLNEMRYERGLPPLVWRGHDDATDRVLKMLGNYAPAVSPETLSEATARLEGWVTQAKQIADIDEAERWVPVPKVPGGRPPRCPYCGTYGLRMARRRGEVRCLYPACTDSEGNPTRARMEPGGMSGEGILVFGDATTMHYREPEPEGAEETA